VEEREKKKKKMEDAKVDTAEATASDLLISTARTQFSSWSLPVVRLHKLSA
jgi:hypothetical protein